MNYAVVIPARYDSTRFPGKPLVALAGRSMIHRVWEKSARAVGENLVYVATDSQKIEEHCKRFTSNVVMTSQACMTGTDRVAEVCGALDLDFVINVQGDEPLIKPEDILRVRDAYLEEPGVIVNAMCAIETEQEFRSLTVPKVAATPDGKLLYMSRAGIPGSKSNSFTWAFKQVCIYAFSSSALAAFRSHGRKTPLEDLEDIEILRFLELGYSVKMLRVRSGSLAVDLPEDVELVEREILRREGTVENS